jgi:hypothetical protein
MAVNVAVEPQPVLVEAHDVVEVLVFALLNPDAFEARVRV